jgi:hypothetical protein
MRRGLVLVLVLLAGCRPPGWGEGGDPDAAGGDAGPGGPDGAPAIDGGPGLADASAAACTVGFRLEGHGGAGSVWLTGDFVQWAGDPGAGALPLALGADAAWTLTRGFDPGTYQYKFIVDGASWIPDPANANTVPDGFGGVNSVYTCP